MTGVRRCLIFAETATIVACGDVETRRLVYVAVVVVVVVAVVVVFFVVLRLSRGNVVSHAPSAQPVVHRSVMPSSPEGEADSHDQKSIAGFSRGRRRYEVYAGVSSRLSTADRLSLNWVTT